MVAADWRGRAERRARGRAAPASFQLLLELREQAAFVGGREGVGELERRGIACVGVRGQGATERPFEFLRERSEEHTSELQSRENLVCRLLLEKKKNNTTRYMEMYIVRV